MNNSGDQFHKGLNTALAIFYCPFSLFCMLFYMVTEIAFHETNVLILFSAYLIAHAGILTPLFSFVGIWLSNRLYHKNKIKASYVIRFLPILVMMFSLLLAFLIEFLVKH